MPHASLQATPPLPSSAPAVALVLGSTSIYRHELLSRLGLPFTVMAPEVDETPFEGETPLALAQRLALAKAHAVAQQWQHGATQGAAPDAVVIGSDQVADLHGTPLGKPGNHERAVQQLQAMRGQTVLFHTAVAVTRLSTGFAQCAVDTVRVQVRPLSDDVIDTYLRLEQPYDCAGSAKAEGLGIALLERIDSSDPTALIGLPLISLTRLLTQAGLDPLLWHTQHT